MSAPETTSKSVVILSGSPSANSKTAKIGDTVADWLNQRDINATHIKVRDFSPEALLRGDMGDASLKAALDLVATADGIVLATPTYKASFSGLLKAFLDLLPQHGLKDKVVMPLGTGGSLAHMLALDYGLRPVMQSMRPRLIVPSVFILDQHLRVEGTHLEIAAESQAYLTEILEEFEHALLNAALAPHSARSAKPALHAVR
jgi:FMN reductase